MLKGQIVLLFLLNKIWLDVPNCLDMLKKACVKKIKHLAFTKDQYFKFYIDTDFSCTRLTLCRDSSGWVGIMLEKLKNITAQTIFLHIVIRVSNDYSLTKYEQYRFVHTGWTIGIFLIFM